MTEKHAAQNGTKLRRSEESERASFCDAIAAPSPTGRDAAGRLSRENNGRGKFAAILSRCGEESRR
ncbi:MAG: hypothetical protein WA571_19630, partial [Candidatus Binatus sp.]